jgi:hypothetical protein
MNGFKAAILIGVGGALVSLILIRSVPVYGGGIFLGAPIAMGVLAGVWSRSAAKGFASGAGVVTMALLTAGCGFFFLGAEGIVCLAMAVPVALPFGLLGVWIGYGLSGLRVNRNGLIVPALLLAPFVTTGEYLLRLQAPLTSVESHVQIDARPETVWPNVIRFPELPEPNEWIFRAGLAYPKRARIEGSGPGAIRYCEFSTGPFVEPIQVWDEPRMLRFSVTHNPEPMRELSLYDIHPPHLNGYFESKQGQFVLTALPNGRTLLTGTTWYRQSLWPGPYWRLWSDAIVHRIHLRVLNHIKSVSESMVSQRSAGSTSRQ